MEMSDDVAAAGGFVDNGIETLEEHRARRAPSSWSREIRDQNDLGALANRFDHTHLDDGEVDHRGLRMTKLLKCGDDAEAGFKQGFPVSAEDTAMGGNVFDDRVAQNMRDLMSRQAVDDSAFLASAEGDDNIFNGLVAAMFPTDTDRYVFDPVTRQQYDVISLKGKNYPATTKELWEASVFCNKSPADVGWPFELAARMYSTLDIACFPSGQRIKMIDLMLPNLRRAMLFHENDHRLLAIVLSALENITQMTEHPHDSFEECESLTMHIVDNMRGPLPSLSATASFAQQFRELLNKPLGIDVLRLARRIMYRIEALSMHDTAFDEFMTFLWYMEVVNAFSRQQSIAAVTSLMQTAYLGELAERASSVALMSEPQQETCMSRMLPLSLELLGMLDVGGFSQEFKSTLYNSLKRMVWICSEGTTWPTEEDREDVWIKHMVREHVARARARHGESPYMTLVCDDLDGSRAV